MSFQTKKRGVILGAILGIFIIFLPLPSYPQGGGQGFVPLKKVAVLPFLILRPAEGERMVEGLWGEFFFRAGEVPSRAGSEAMTIFYHQLLRLGRCEMIPLDQAATAVEEVGPITFKQDPLGEAVRIGRQLGVYAVVIGGVYRFEQRRGSALGVERPASVALDAHLVRVEDKKVIWSGRLDETQRSLSENLLKVSIFVKGGGHWVTVERLTAIGVESVLRTFPSLTF